MLTVMGLLALLGTLVFLIFESSIVVGQYTCPFSPFSFLIVLSGFIKCAINDSQVFILGSGETQVLTQLSDDPPENNTIGVLASTHKPMIPGTSDSWQATIIVYNSKDNVTSSDVDQIQIQLKGFPTQQGLLVC